MAFWHGRILPATYYFRRRGIVVITSENFDGEWIARHHRALRLRHGARIDVAGRAEGDAAAHARHGGGEAGRASRSTVRAARRASRSPAPSGWRKATGNPVLPFHLEAVAHWTLRSWDRTQIPKPFSTVALVIGEPLDVPGEATEEALEAARQELERRLAAWKRARSRCWTALRAPRAR